ncbi:MAG TPA: exo-alpha-sialidase [Clostridiaceae bacterium]|nr:exo-alpha-sialidase [Clostridiaceae bacterium]
MSSINVIETGILFENKLPQLRSRHGYFPGIIKMNDGTLMAAYVVGEAFESVDLTTEISISRDEGRTWERIGKIYDKRKSSRKTSDSLKLTQTKDGRLLAFGYEMDRSNPCLPIGNVETGGILDSNMVLFESTDMGKSWGDPVIIPNSFLGDPVEASAPLVELKNGHLVTPIANFKNWEGICKSGLHSRLLRSEDGGRTWDDSTVIMEFPGRNITIWEQRLCQTESGMLCVISWNEDLANGIQLPNHFALSYDNGKTFEKPQSTGIMGQASGLVHIEGEKILSLHCMRRGTDKPGIYAYIVDLSNGTWDIIDEKVVWEPKTLLQANKKMMDVFAFLKFGQPSAIRLNQGGDFLMVNWIIEEGQGKIIWTRLNII